jgi:hypothetical protein
MAVERVDAAARRNHDHVLGAVAIEIPDGRRRDHRLIDPARNSVCPAGGRCAREFEVNPPGVRRPAGKLAAGAGIDGMDEAVGVAEDDVEPAAPGQVGQLWRGGRSAGS